MCGLTSADLHIHPGFEVYGIDSRLMLPDWVIQFLLSTTLSSPSLPRGAISSAYGNTLDAWGVIFPLGIDLSLWENKEKSQPKHCFFYSQVNNSSF
jgi:hypothetical protein